MVTVHVLASKPVAAFPAHQSQWLGAAGHPAAIARAADAHALLASPTFCQEWRALQDQCPWATPFQSPGFVATWYEVYKEACEPVLLTGRDEKGRLTALLTLARPVGSDRLIVAGTPQSEYQVWLALPACSDAFIAWAVEQLQRANWSDSLTFAYLPPLTPLDWLRTNPKLARRCQIEAVRCPVIRLQDIDQGQFRNFTRNKTVRNQLNRLNRLGELCLERVTEPAGLEPVFDEIIAHYDCRMGALLGHFPFRNDPPKKPFLMALLAESDVLHVTILRAGNTLVGANLGFRHKDTVCLGVFSHSPFLAKCSPGKLFLMMLAKQLAHEGFSQLDLTPDGQWKDRFATTQGEVYELTIHLRSWAQLRSCLEVRVKGAVKGLLAMAGVDSERVAAAWRPAQGSGIAGLLRPVWRKAAGLRRAPGVRVYSFKTPHAEPRTAMDRLDQLLAGAEEIGRQSTKSLCSGALKLLEAGCHVHTYVRDGQLCWRCWSLVAETQKPVPGTVPTFVLPRRSAALFGFHANAAPDIDETSQACLQEVVQGLSRLAGIETVYLLVDVNDDQTRRAVERIGCMYERRLGQADRPHI